MVNTAKQNNSLDLTTLLLGTLDEGVFFQELSKHLNSEIKANEVTSFLVKDEKLILITKNGKVVKRQKEITDFKAAVAQVAKNNRPYFSNDISSDPLFDSQDSHVAFLAIPVSVEGVVVGVIRFIKENDQFSRETINFCLKTVKEIENAVRNLKLYLSAKFLNEALTAQLANRNTASALVEVSEDMQIEAPSIVAKSAVMSELLQLADKVAKSDVSLLIEGEDGTGKERLAQYIHANSKRAEAGYRSINCAALAADELRVELFGHESDGSVKEGLIEQLGNGTLVLRNIHTIDLETQGRLLSLVKDGRIFRINGSSSIASDVRIISTTTKKIGDLVEQGLFRQDLYYCLNMMTLATPRLSERVEDIDDLADQLLNGQRRSDEHKSLTPGALKILQEYDWRGNINELKKVLEQAYLLASGIMIDIAHLDLEQRESEIVEEEPAQEQFDFDDITLDELERRFICATLERLKGNKTKTAKALGITVKTLYNKLHSYDMISSEAN